MGWLMLKEFGGFSEAELKSANDDAPLSFGMLRKIYATIQQIEDDLNALYNDDSNVDHATQEFEAIANTYKFGDLTPRLRQFTNLKAWQAEMDRLSVSNLGEFVQVSNLLRWVFRQELDSGGSGTGKGRFKIKFKLKHGRQFKVEITKFEYREAPGSGRRKIEMDLEVTYI